MQPPGASGYRPGAPLRLDLAPVAAVRVRTGDRLWAGRAELEARAPALVEPGETPAALAGRSPARVTAVLEPRGTVRALEWTELELELEPLPLTGAVTGAACAAASATSGRCTWRGPRGPTSCGS